MGSPSSTISVVLAGDKRWFVADSLARAGGRILAVLVLARLLGTADFASFVLLATVEAIVGGLASATLCQPIVRVAPGLPEGEQEALFALTMRRARVYAGICLLVLPGVMWAVSGGTAAVGLLAAFSVAMAVGTIIGARQAVLTARFRARRQFLASAGGLVTLAGTFGGLVLLGAGAHGAYWCGVAVGAGVAWVIGISAARVDAPGAPDAASRERLDVVRNAQAGSLAGQVLAQRVQPFLLTLIDGANAVRQFGGAAALLGPARLAANTLVGVAEPRLARGLRGPGADRTRWLVTAMCAGIAATGVPSVVVCALAEPELARLALGGKFDDLGGALKWAAAWATCDTIAALLGVYVQLSLLRGPRAALRAQWAGTIVSLGVSWALGVRFGASGAMAGIAIGSAVQVAALCVELRARRAERAGGAGTAAMRGDMVRVAERAAGEIVGAWPRVFGRVSENRVHVLCLHRCEGARVAEVVRMVELVQRGHEVVAYGEAVRRLRDGAARPTVALTFDDGTADHLAVARALAERKVRACFFVCPGLLDVSGDSEGTARACVEWLKTAPTGLLGWEDVREIAAMGHEIGCHSATHPDFGSVAVDAIDEQIAGARDRLVSRGVGAEHFAWPFGRFARFTPEAARRVFDAGFESCASAERGWQVGAAGGSERSCVRREVVGEEESGASVVSRLAYRATRAPVRGSGWPLEWVETIVGA